MVTHPAVGHYTGTLVNALLAHCKDLSGIGGELKPGIVHRLDKDTSGVIVAAKNDKAHQSLSKQFKEHTVKKIYIALVSGFLKNEEGTILEPIGRHPVHRKKMAVVRAQSTEHRAQGTVGKQLKGREAVTHYKVLDKFEDKEGNKYSLLEIRIETGRTHQIRVHLSHIGHPIIGDSIYGGRKSLVFSHLSSTHGQLLHAKTLSFVHPSTNKQVEFDSDIPEDMSGILEHLKDNKRIK